MSTNKSEVTQRTFEQISSILLHAKLDENDFLPTTQVLHINEETAKPDQYKILELDDHLLETLKNKDTLVFKGEDDDDIVLCTETRTYDVRECETSNSLLMFSDLDFSDSVKLLPGKNINNKHVLGINHKYFEVIPTKPRSEKVMLILNNTKYRGPEHESENLNSSLVTFEELLKVSQFSRTELKDLLKKLDVITIAQKVRLLDIEYHFRVLSYILKSVDEHSWAADEVQKEKTVTSWSEIVPREVLENMFDIYTEKTKVVDSEQLYKYKENKVCQFYAKVLLHYSRKFNFSDFLQAWRESVPEGMTPKEEMLRGLAIIDRDHKPPIIWNFPENDLPDTVEERFDKLFSVKSKWPVEEIIPYISSLTTEKMDASALLAKYARACKVNGVRVYCAKHNI